jgi:hypothetical protein
MTTAELHLLTYQHLVHIQSLESITIVWNDELLKLNMANLNLELRRQVIAIYKG